MAERVMVAMSGGLDSAVAAALLVDRGYEIVGATLRLMEGGSRCCSLGDIDDARRTCETLGIPHYVLDSRAEFQEAVIDRFLSETEAGRTPNPCVGCNSKIKFGVLLEQAVALDCDYIATGHYARIVQRDGRYAVRAGLDGTKDQSYFLFELSQFQLQHTLFPLGDMVKDQSKVISADRNLLPATKPESQDLCFLPKGGHRQYLHEHLPHLERPGRFVTTDGTVMGQHDGAMHFTIGQRRGIGLGGGPWYVTAIDSEANDVVIGRVDDVQSRTTELHGVRWMLPPADGDEVRATVRIRYAHEPASALVRDVSPGIAEIVFDEPQFAITPGQAAVFYDDDVVLGGGWVASR